jgi:hypothetical protein
MAFTYRIVPFTHDAGREDALVVEGVPKSRISATLRELERGFPPSPYRRFAFAVIYDVRGNIAGVASPHSRSRWSVAISTLRGS